MSVIRTIQFTQCLVKLLRGVEVQMVKRKCVKPLRHFCLKSLPHLVAGHVREGSISYLKFDHIL